MFPMTVARYDLIMGGNQNPIDALPKLSAEHVSVLVDLGDAGTSREVNAIPIVRSERDFRVALVCVLHPDQKVSLDPSVLVLAVPLAVLDLVVALDPDLDDRFFQFHPLFAVPVDLHAIRILDPRQTERVPVVGP